MIFSFFGRLLFGGGASYQLSDGVPASSNLSLRGYNLQSEINLVYRFDSFLDCGDWASVSSIGNVDVYSYSIAAYRYNLNSSIIGSGELALSDIDVKQESASSEVHIGVAINVN